MENTGEIIQRTTEQCFPAKACVNYGLVASINGEISAGLSLLSEQVDPEIEAEIQDRREQLRAICDACPVGKLTASISIEPVSASISSGQGLRESIGRQATYSDVISVARRIGLSIVGGGNHPFAIEGSDGRKFAIPTHPGSLSPGVISNARKFLASYMGA